MGCATLQYRAGPGGDDSGRQYFKAGDDNRTYRLKTNEDDPAASTYDDLAALIRTINGIGLRGGDERFGTDTFRASVDAIMNAQAFLRWAAVNLLLGSWDNYYATPSNYYLYNSGHPGAERRLHAPPLFHLHPVGLRQLPGHRLLRHAMAVHRHPQLARLHGQRLAGQAGSRIPLVHNLLRNRDYRQSTWTTWNSCSTPSSTRAPSPRRSRPSPAAGCGSRVCQAAYLESGTPGGQPFTGRQFTNDEVYRSGWKQYELRHGKEKAEGIIHYVRMRHDSARQQLAQLRGATPRANGSAGFPAAMEALPRSA